MDRRFLSPLFAILIFVAHLNCVIEHRITTPASGQSATSESYSATDNSTLPGQTHSACDHGSCICKGATLAEVVVINVDGLSSSVGAPDWLANESRIDCGAIDGAKNDDVFPTRPLCALPVRANDRCALLQAFVL